MHIRLIINRKEKKHAAWVVCLFCCVFFYFFALSVLCMPSSFGLEQNKGEHLTHTCAQVTVHSWNIDAVWVTFKIVYFFVFFSRYFVLVLGNLEKESGNEAHTTKKEPKGVCVCVFQGGSRFDVWCVYTRSIFDVLRSINFRFFDI